MEKGKVHIFLCGEYRANAGPSNVNRYLLTRSKNQLSCVKSENILLKRLERYWRLLFSDVTVFSGYGYYVGFAIRILRLLHKKSVYLMHGCVAYENHINELGISSKIIQKEDYILHNVDLILCVSEQYMKWVVQRFPELKDRAYYLNSGIDDKEYENINLLRDESDEKVIKIVAAGGDRNQKNNLEICKAVEKIAGSTDKAIMFDIFGRCYAAHNVFSDYLHTRYRGMVPKEELYQALHSSKVFVLNSEIESFGLAIVDALMCGCSVLVTQNAGICSLLSLQESDIIYNVHATDEIAKKIDYVIEHPNNKRLINSIDFDNCSWKSISERLYAICACLQSGQDYTSIR